MGLRNLVLKNRSCRRFYQEVLIEFETLEQLIDLARHSASAANLQPLKYILSCKHQKNDLVFPHLEWAGYLKDWLGPSEGERPSAYIVILGDTRIRKTFECDHGIAAQNILLGATEKGLGGASFNQFSVRNFAKFWKYLPIIKFLLSLPSVSLRR